MRASLHTRLLNDYLVKVDRASMINSLEVRSPFLDRELADYAFSLPAEWKFHQGFSKYILKRLATKYFDPSVFTKPKRGFGFPVGKWLHKGFQQRLKELADPDSPIYKTGLFEQKAVIGLIKGFNQGLPGLEHKTWLLLCLDEWCRIFNCTS
jgi:asparagine synthase (glutamine-hydrolysing)